MPIWLQWVMVVVFLIGSGSSLLSTVAALRRGGVDRPYMLGKMTGETVTLTLGIIGLVYLIGGGK